MVVTVPCFRQTCQAFVSGSVLRTMYTIKEAAARSGVPVQLLRAWERRYGVVAPARTDSGYRLYDEPAIARLRAMRRLVDEGWAPSTAAAHLGPLNEGEVGAILNRVAAGETARSTADATNATAEALTDEFVNRAADMDEPAVERVLDDMFSRGSFEQVTSELVMPALVALGDAWARGRIDVAAEHAAAGAIQRRLGSAFFAAGLPRGGDVVLVGLPPGARHELGALTFATAARRSGISVRYLGADLPIQDWIDAIGRTSARGVVVGVVTKSDIDPATSLAEAVRAAHPGVVIAIGGGHAANVSAKIPGAVVLPAALAGAVAALNAALSDARAVA